MYKEKLTELIKKLNETKEGNGDLEVGVQYRDTGGCYYGVDNEIEFYVEKGKMIIKYGKGTKIFSTITSNEIGDLITKILKLRKQGFYIITYKQLGK